MRSTDAPAKTADLSAPSRLPRPAAVDIASEGRLLRLRGRGCVLVAFPPEAPGILSQAPKKAE